MTVANNHFGSSNGSENFYQHLTIIYSDGVKSLTEECKSYWLLDLIASYQNTKKMLREPFQVWELLRKDECEFDVVVTDGNHHILETQQIPYSDFPYDKATLWLVDRTLLMPCEY